jgi:hypothetical protein
MRLVSGAMAMEPRLAPWDDERVDVTGALERLFDKGVVIDPWVRVSTSGIDLMTDPIRVVVASIETYPAAPATPSSPGV